MIREGKANDETVKKMTDAFDHLFGTGRKFNDTDRKKLAEANKNHTLDPGKAPPRTERPEETKGRARDELTGGKTLDRATTTAGELKEDELGRPTEKTRAKIAPEYRKALEDYYKSLSK